MAESDRLDPNKLWLWLDFETTELNVDHLTVVQAGWTVTNSKLVQLIPIRSRFCAFSASARVITPLDGGCWDGLNDEVITMHEQSGLTTSYEYTQPYQIVRSMATFDQLILDSLFECGWDGENRVVLAGAGVAGFDRRVLVANRSLLAGVLHYRSADTSVACELLGIPVPKTLEQFESFLDVRAGDPRSLRVDDEFPGLGSLHQAPVDVAAALLTARVLRARLEARDA